MKVAREQEISQIEIGKPHVVILGAGASKASFPHGDRNGKKLPLMDDFIDVLELAPLLDKTDVEYKSRNFEEIYADLYGRREYASICRELEILIYRYFSELKITDVPCRYDHLILSLREKDVIATFNWDPFLMQAYLRNKRRYKKLPELLFLHGNVAVGVCLRHRERGINGNLCSRCRKPYMPTKLFYPVLQKNYHDEPDIADQWSRLDEYLKDALLVTIFGYGAPASDWDARKLLKKGWGEPLDRRLEQIEIIDRKDKDRDALRKTWKSFIHAEHYDIRSDFYDSWIADYPRRTGEAFYNQYIRNSWEGCLEKNPIPAKAGFEELWVWFDVLYKNEFKHNN
ncbi:MAG: hypothetical protein HZB54_08445 [Deltaproteobacteria bacterium]|nr:hypothetical protein [Deltaproteobacteria bacterium]